MTLSKAIELLEQELKDPGSVDPADLRKAQELGLEALKAEKRRRHLYLWHEFNLFPGETKK